MTRTAVVVRHRDQLDEAIHEPLPQEVGLGMQVDPEVQTRPEGLLQDDHSLEDHHVDRADRFAPLHDVVVLVGVPRCHHIAIAGSHRVEEPAGSEQVI